MPTSLPILEVHELSKTFTGEQYSIKALHHVSLRIEEGEFIILFGPSGSGKSTLLHAICGLEKPTAGTVRFYGTDLYNKSENELNFYRKQFIGLLNQHLTWIKFLNVQENIALPLLLSGADHETAIQESRKALSQVSLVNRAYNHPLELSQGEQQKALLARALIISPDILVADEPTGNLDSRSGDEILRMLSEIHAKGNRTVIVATHNESYFHYADRIVFLQDGTIVRIEKNHEKNHH